MGGNMKRKLAGTMILFATVLLFITAGVYFADRAVNPQDLQAGQIVAANEVEQLIRMGKQEEAAQKAAALQQMIRESGIQKENDGSVFLLCGVALVFLVSVFGYVYFAILRPFDKMKEFARQIAQGNFDVPLNYERSNYFGAFTWAFDSMRREITKARACEREAVENNKTVIATLSHDIKTPIASIRAYAEGLEANLDRAPQKREKYVSVLMRKCDEVSKLTNDLFLHSLSDLEKLKMNPEELELCAFVETAVREIAAERGDVRFQKPEESIMVTVDKNRLLQLIENIINNARKYAKSQVDVMIIKENGSAKLQFRDYGAGIPDADMPFVFDKFYRGKNCANEQGSGLGLYIVKYITEQMGGTVLLHNHSDGLEVVAAFPVK